MSHGKLLICRFPSNLLYMASHRLAISRGPQLASILEITQSLFPITVEVWVQAGSGPAKIAGVKPKVYLTAAVKLPPQTWTKVT